MDFSPATLPIQDTKLGTQTTHPLFRHLYGVHIKPWSCHKPLRFQTARFDEVFPLREFMRQPSLEETVPTGHGSYDNIYASRALLSIMIDLLEFQRPSISYAASSTLDVDPWFSSQRNASAAKAYWIL